MNENENEELKAKVLDNLAKLSKKLEGELLSLHELKRVATRTTILRTWGALALALSLGLLIGVMI